MASPFYRPAILLIILLVSLVSGEGRLTESTTTRGIAFNLGNDCKRTIRLVIRHGRTFNATEIISLQPGQSIPLTAPSGWNGCVQARTDRNREAGRTSLNSSTRTSSPVTVVELDSYNVSRVAGGFALPPMAAVPPEDKARDCSLKGCDGGYGTPNFAVKCSRADIFCGIRNLESELGTPALPLQSMKLQNGDAGIEKKMKIIEKEEKFKIQKKKKRRKKKKKKCLYREQKVVCNGSEDLRAIHFRWWCIIVYLVIIVAVPYV